MTAISTILLVYAYENFKQSLQCQIAQQREEAIIKEVTKSLSTDKKITAKERDERFVFWISLGRVRDILKNKNITDLQNENFYFLHEQISNFLKGHDLLVTNRPEKTFPRM